MDDLRKNRCSGRADEEAGAFHDFISTAIFKAGKTPTPQADERKASQRSTWGTAAR
jgi:hypothetical protein